MPVYKCRSWMLHLAVELDGLTTLSFASGVGFFLFLWLLCSVLLGVLLEYFSLLRRVTGDMHQACFVTVQPIYQMSCMAFPAISSAALLRFGWQCGFSSLTFPAMTGTVGLCPGGGFRMCSSFIGLLRNLHAFKNIAYLLVGLPLKFPAL